MARFVPQLEKICASLKCSPREAIKLTKCQNLREEERKRKDCKNEGIGK
jgi:hypothetical protein